MTEKQLRSILSETESRLKASMGDVVKTTLEALGIEACEPRETQSDMIFLRKTRLLMESAGNKIVLVIVGLLATGVAGSVWFAIKHYK